MKVEELFTEIMLNSEMDKIPIGYKSCCMTAIRETLSNNGISMEREVNIELSESIYGKSVSDTTELYEPTTTYDELFR